MTGAMQIRVVAGKFRHDAFIVIPLQRGLNGDGNAIDADGVQTTKVPVRSAIDQLSRGVRRPGVCREGKGEAERQAGEEREDGKDRNKRCHQPTAFHASVSDREEASIGGSSGGPNFDDGLPIHRAVDVWEEMARF